MKRQKQIHIEIVPHELRFKEPAGTSRGIYHSRRVWFLLGKDTEGNEGIGECAPLPDLSVDARQSFNRDLVRICREVEKDTRLLGERYRHFPSILMGLETMLRSIEKGFCHYDTPFSRGEKGISINGLIWMGSHDKMLQRIEKKLNEVFRCLKLKVGAIDFEQELDLVKRIRDCFPAEQLELRLDANGGFSKKEALSRLEALAPYHIHSLEQPIRAGHWNALRLLVEQSPIPIALDEELIGVNKEEAKRSLLEFIHPHYIILKPTLHGGFYGADEWIQLAEELKIAWWGTSALESNIGLNAIAQWLASHEVTRPQGLGTGRLFEQNIPAPLTLDASALHYHPERPQTISHHELLSFLRRTKF